MLEQTEQSPTLGNGLMNQNVAELASEIAQAYNNGRSLIWFIECDGVLIEDVDANVSTPLASESLAALRRLSELNRVLVALGGTRSVSEIQQSVPITKAVIAGYSGSQIDMRNRQVVHSGVTLARRMIENLGRWIESDLSTVAGAQVKIEPLSVVINLAVLDPSERKRVRAIIVGILDKFRATVRVIETEDSLAAVWTLASNSGAALDSVLQEFRQDSPLVCCVASHAWMNDALACARSNHGISIGVSAETASTAQFRFDSPDTVAQLFNETVHRLGEQG